MRRLHFIANGRFVVPHWLLRSVTHSASTEPILPSELLNMFHQMTALTYLEFHPYSYLWNNSEVDKLRLLQIQMTQLANLIAHTSTYPDTCIRLNRLLLNEGVKRRLGLQQSVFCGQISFMDWTGGLSPLLEAADGF